MYKIATLFENFASMELSGERFLEHDFGLVLLIDKYWLDEFLQHGRIVRWQRIAVALVREKNAPGQARNGLSED